MKKYNHKYLYLVLIFFLSSCMQPQNNKDAHLLIRNDLPFLMLTGKRVPLVHDPISILTSKLIDDTLLIRIPSINDGIIEGKDIQVEEGYNKYQGYISIKKNIIVVNLQIIDTDSKKIVPEIYNGTYNLHIIK